MTTIACDGKMIASDGLVTGNGMIHETNCRKAFRLKDGSVVGMAGSVYFHDQMLEFLNDERDTIDFDETGFEALQLMPDGTCYCYDNKGRRYVQSVPCASGSGAAYALTAMYLGRNVAEAVGIASKLDTGSGGTIFIEAPEIATSGSLNEEQ